MDKLYIATEADRMGVAAVLVKNGYTVRQGKEKYKKTYAWFIEYSRQEPERVKPLMPIAAAAEQLAAERAGE